MATLISVYGSEGLIGRCDAKCYEAEDPSCDCICGGLNHGAGFQRAHANTQQFCEEWVKRYTTENGIENYKALLGEAAEANLFDDPMLHA